ncbi:hypothetical protein L7F22_049343 [Adiantum nelumboides]|nr:hypothetical protein [Adiantum nelumboides]
MLAYWRTHPLAPPPPARRGFMDHAPPLWGFSRAEWYLDSTSPILVEIKLPLTPGMNAIIKSKLPVPTYHEAVLTAHRYVGKTAATAGIIHGACSDVNSTRETAVKKASELASRNYDRLVYKALKEEMFKWEAGELLHGSLEGVPESLARASRL